MACVILPSRRKRPDLFELDHSHFLAQNLLWFPHAYVINHSFITNLAKPYQRIPVVGNSKVVYHHQFSDRPAVSTPAITDGYYYTTPTFSVNFPITLSLWQYVGSMYSGIGGTCPLLRIGDYNTFKLGLLNSYGTPYTFRGNVSVGYTSVFNHQIMLSSEWTPGWAHIAVQLNQYSQSLFFNGVKVADATASLNSTYTVTPCLATDGPAGCTGFVSDGMVHKKILSEDEIKVLANRTDPMLAGMIRDKKPAPKFWFLRQPDDFKVKTVTPVVLSKGTSKNPNIKPPMWGNESDIDRAVKDNCLKLGIPFPDIYSPMWQESTLGAVSRHPDGYMMNGTSAVSVNVGTLKKQISYDVSVLYATDYSGIGLYQSLIGSSRTLGFSFGRNDENDPSRMSFIYAGANVYGWHYAPLSHLDNVVGGSVISARATCTGTKHTKFWLSNNNAGLYKSDDTHTKTSFDTTIDTPIRVQGVGAGIQHIAKAVFLWDAFIPDKTMEFLHANPFYLLQPTKKRVVYSFNSKFNLTGAQDLKNEVKTITLPSSGLNPVSSPAVHLPSRRKRPDVFTLDYSHPLAQGLVFCDLVKWIGGYNDALGHSFEVVGTCPLAFSNAISRPGRVYSGAKRLTSFKTLSSHQDFTIAAFLSGLSLDVAMACANNTNAWAVGGFRTTGTIPQFWLRNTSASSVFIDFTGSTKAGLYHYCGVYSGGIGYAYLDGKLVNSAPGPGGTMQFNNFSVGGALRTVFEPGNSTAFDPIFFDRALSPAEISILADRTDPMLGGLIMQAKPRTIYSIGKAPCIRFGVGDDILYSNDNQELFVGKDILKI